jgi:hypothetical protein
MLWISLLSAGMFLRTLIQAGAALVGVCVASAISRSVVKDDLDTSEAGHIKIQSNVHNATGIHYVKNSGICETTPNVTQISGYIDVGKNMSMVRLCEHLHRCELIRMQWFWFFESRNSPETAPFTLW